MPAVVFAVAVLCHPDYGMIKSGAAMRINME